jgi:hypothetical protein
MKDNILIVTYKINDISANIMIYLENSTNTSINFNKKINLSIKEDKIDNYIEFIDLIKKSIYIDTNILIQTNDIIDVIKKTFIYT